MKEDSFENFTNRSWGLEAFAADIYLDIGEGAFETLRN